LWPLKIRWSAIDSLSHSVTAPRKSAGEGAGDQAALPRSVVFSTGRRRCNNVPIIADDRHDPDFWMYETSGVLRPAVRTYLKGKRMTAKDIAAIRTYLRVWIFAPEFDSEGVEALRQTVDGLASREAIEDWLATARKEWVSPL